MLYPFLRLITGPNFVDVGCGIGIFLNYGSINSIGLDINPYNINSINLKNKRKGLLIKNDGKFPIKSSSFNSIICDQVLEHIEDPSLLISEISRIVKRGGKIIIGLPLEKGFKSDPDHKIFYTLNSLKNKFCEKYPLSYSYHFYFPLPVKIFGKFFSWQYMYVIFKSTK